MFCSQCGVEIENDENVCPVCGSALSEAAPEHIVAELADGNSGSDSGDSLPTIVAELVESDDSPEASCASAEGAGDAEPASDETDAKAAADTSESAFFVDAVEPESSADSADSAQDLSATADDSNRADFGSPDEAENPVAPDAKPNPAEAVKAVKDAAAPLVDGLKSVDLGWAKDGLHAIRERQETLQAISEAQTEIDAAKAELQGLRDELAGRLDVESRYEEIKAVQGKEIDVAQDKLVKSERELAKVVAELGPAQAKLDRINAIHARLIKPYEEDYENMREQMRAAEKVLAEAQVVVDKHSATKQGYESELESIHQKLLGFEAELDKIAAKSSISMSEKMRLGNQIAMEMGSLQRQKAEIQEKVEAEEKAMAPDLRRVKILTEDKEPIEAEFEEVKRDLLRQRDLFRRQNAPLTAKLDEVNARLVAKNQEVSDLRDELHRAEEVLILAQDVHDHPEKTEELRLKIAEQEKLVHQLESKKNQLDSQEQLLRGADNKGKLIIAGIIGVVVLIAVVLAFIG